MTMLTKVRNIALAAGLAFLPLAAHATDSVRLESRLGVANASAGEKVYNTSTNAKTDETVQVSLWYHNTEDANSNKVAQNLKAQLQLPTAAGKTQNIKGTISADNGNTVNTNATVNLTPENSRLEMVPGTALWRHNKGTNEQPNWVTEGLTPAQEQALLNGGVVLENEKPCFNFEATVTVKLRVKTDAIGITKQVRVAGQKDWTTSNVAKAGDTLEYRIKFQNDGNTVLKNVAIADKMPDHVTYVPGTAKLANGNHPDPISVSENLFNGGVDVGDYAPGAVGYIMFSAKVDPQLPGGTYDLKNTAAMRAAGQYKYAEAHTKVVVEGPKECKPGIPVGDTRCTPTTPTTPVVPTTGPQPLPQTGVEGAAAGFLGTTGLTYAGYFYRRSRKALTSALRNK